MLQSICYFENNVQKYWIDEDYYGYVYLTYDQKEKKVYIGQKKGKISSSKNYFGSGTWIKRIQKKRGTYFLKKIILGICYSKKELTVQETECKIFFNTLDPLYGYNIVLEDDIGDRFTNHPDREEIRKKLSEKGKWKRTEKHKEALSKAKLGVPLSKKHRESLKGIPKKNKITKENVFIHYNIDKNYFFELHNNNLCQTKIAKKLNVKLGVILKIYDVFDLKPNASNRAKAVGNYQYVNVSQEIIDEILYLYTKKDYTIKQLCKKFNLTKNVIKNRLIQNNIKLIPWCERIKGKPINYYKNNLNLIEEIKN
jgi:hypothetical protein